MSYFLFNGDELSNAHLVRLAIKIKYIQREGRLISLGFTTVTGRILLFTQRKLIGVMYPGKVHGTKLSAALANTREVHDRGRMERGSDGKSQFHHVAKVTAHTKRQTSSLCVIRQLAEGDGINPIKQISLIVIK